MNVNNTIAQKLLYIYKRDTVTLTMRSSLTNHHVKIIKHNVKNDVQLRAIFRGI